MVEIPGEKPPLPAPGPAHLALARWPAMIPAMLMLAFFSLLWGMTSLAGGYRARAAEEMDEALPLVVALADGVTMSQAQDLAGQMRALTPIQSVRVASSDVALAPLLPKGQAWADEIAGLDARHIPPALVVVARNGARDREARAAAARAIKAASPLVDFVWPDGPDVAAIRGRLEDTSQFIDRIQWIALLLSAGAWLVFLFVDFKGAAFLAGRNGTYGAGDGMPGADGHWRRRWAPALIRGALIAAGAGVLAAAAMGTMPYLLGELAPAWAMRDAVTRAVFFAAVAGVAGHGVVCAILPGHARPAPRVSIRV